MSYLVKDYMERSFPKMSVEASASEAAKAMSGPAVASSSSSRAGNPGGSSPRGTWSAR